MHGWHWAPSIPTTFQYTHQASFLMSTRLADLPSSLPSRYPFTPPVHGSRLVFFPKTLIRSFLFPIYHRLRSLPDLLPVILFFRHSYHRRLSFPHRCILPFPSSFLSPHVYYSTSTHSKGPLSFPSLHTPIPTNIPSP